MQTRLIAIGNSFGVRLPKSIISQLSLDKTDLEISVIENGVLITPVSNVPPLSAWDRLFKEAKKKGFDPKKDAEDFDAWNITLSDGID